MKHYVQNRIYSTSNVNAHNMPDTLGFARSAGDIVRSVNTIHEANQANIEKQKESFRQEQAALDARAAQERTAIDNSWQSEWAKMHPTQSQIDMAQYRKNVADREARERAEAKAQERMFQDTGTTADEWDEYEAQTMLEELKAQNDPITQRRIDEARRAGLL